MMNLIEQAIGVLEADGWCQGRMIDGDTGERCIIGALSKAAALGGTATGSYPWMEACWALKNQVQSQSIGFPDVISWNDRHGRTLDEVTEMMRYAAKRLDA